MNTITQPNWTEILLTISGVLIGLLILALIADYMIRKMDKGFNDNNMTDDNYGPPDDFIC